LCSASGGRAEIESVEVCAAGRRHQQRGPKPQRNLDDAERPTDSVRPPPAIR
jgi:hypothetical protein